MVNETRLYFSHPGLPADARITIDGLGWHERMPKGMIRHGGRGSGYPCLLIIFHTPAWIAAANEARLPAGGQLILWEREAFHHYGNPEAEWDHSWIRIGGTQAMRAMKKCGMPRNVPVTIASTQHAEAVIHLLYQELNRSPLQDVVMVERLMNILWHELRRTSAPGAIRPPVERRMQLARQHIEDNFTQPLNLATAAARVGLSAAHFCHLFSNQVGTPPREYLIRLRMHRARQLLSDPQLQVHEVSKLVGYDDSFYFSRLFKRRHGLSPNEFRRQRSAR